MADSEKCQICYIDYDLDEHIAVTFSQCGHNTCRFCADQILKSNNKACSSCRKPFPSGPNATKYTIDLNIREKVEYTLKFQKCAVHEGKVLDLYCRTDKQRICVECQYSKDASGHKGHNIERIQDLEPIIKPRLEPFIQKRIKACEGEGKKIFEESRQEELDNLRILEGFTKIMALESFINSKAILDRKENGSKGNEEEKRLDPKASQYPYKYLEDSDFVKLVEGENEKGKDFDREKLIAGLKEAKSQISRPIITQDQTKVRIEAPKSVNRVQISSFLHFELKNGELIVKATDEFDKNTVLDMEHWEKEVKSISFIFNKFNYNEEDNLVLEYVFTRLQKQVHSISFEHQNNTSLRTPKTRLEEHLIDFPKLIFSQPQKLQSIRLRFSKSTGSDRLVRYMTERILPRAHALDTLAIICESTDLEENSLAEFAKVLSSREQLKVFQLTLQKTPIQSLAGLSFVLPNLRSFIFSTDLAVGNSTQTPVLKLLQNLFASANALTSCCVELTTTTVPEAVTLFPALSSQLKDNSMLELALPGLTVGKLEDYKNRMKAAVMKDSNKKLIKIKLNSETIISIDN